jgi:hypothetical protein
MKTRVETTVVPEETYTTTHYGCEFCDFETSDLEDFEKHHATLHAAKKEQELGGTKFYWFDSEADAKAWLDATDDHYDYTYVTWAEPGWYGLSSSFSRGGCRCGGCERFSASLTSLASWIDSWRAEITKHEQSIADRLKHIEVAVNLNTKEQS